MILFLGNRMSYKHPSINTSFITMKKLVNIQWATLALSLYLTIVGQATGLHVLVSTALLCSFITFFVWGLATAHPDFASCEFIVPRLLRLRRLEDLVAVFAVFVPCPSYICNLPQEIRSRKLGLMIFCLVFIPIVGFAIGKIPRLLKGK